MSWDGMFGSHGNDVGFFGGTVHGKYHAPYRAEFQRKMTLLFVQLQVVLNKGSSCETSSQMVAIESNKGYVWTIFKDTQHEGPWVA